MLRGAELRPAVQMRQKLERWTTAQLIGGSSQAASKLPGHQAGAQLQLQTTSATFQSWCLCVKDCTAQVPKFSDPLLTYGAGGLGA